MLETQSPVLYRAISRGTLPTYGRKVVEGAPGEARSCVAWQRSIADIETKPYRRLRALAIAAYWQSIADAQARLSK